MSDRGEGVALAIVVIAGLLAGGLALIPPHGVFREPHSATKNLAIVAIALTALAAPLAVAEFVTDSRFERARRGLEARRAWDRIVSHDDGTARGLRFEAIDGEVALLLEPAAGLGAPRVVDIAPPVMAPSEIVGP